VCVQGKILLKLILKKWDGESLTGLIWLRKGAVGGELVNAVMKLRVPKNVEKF
jgi:hypothetical protein